MLQDNDQREGYCRALGHYVKFAYCRQVSRGMPCARVLDCWFENFDVQRFIQEHYSPAEIEAFLQPSPPKVANLLELIEKAKRDR